MANISVGDIFRFLSQWAPTSLAEEWDNVGLQVGSLKEVVSGVLVSLDVTEVSLKEALEYKANLLITHHPLIFRPLRQIDESRLESRLVRFACQKNINILSFHTNLDSTRQGLNDLLATKLGIKKLRPLIPTRDQKYPKAGLGRVGKLSPTTLKFFLENVSSRLNLQNLRFVGNMDHSIETAAVMTGSGGNFYREAAAAGADVLVTGDVKYHAALEALSEGIAIVDIGHFAGEIGMAELVRQKLTNWLRKRDSSLPVQSTRSAFDPFKFYSRKI